MARTKKVKTEAKEEIVEIVGKTSADEKKKGLEESSATVAIACCLPFDMKFSDVPDRKNGGVKSVTLPGLNSDLRGKPSGILLGTGEAVCVNLLKSDWEAIKAMHGKERAFMGWNGNPPCIWEMGTVKEFKNRRDEIADMSHGLEPIDPKKAGVQERSNEE